MRLDPRQRAILRAFRSLDPQGEFQYNAWFPSLVRAIENEIQDVRRSDPNVSVGGWQRELVSLTKRNALVAAGRGRSRQWGISKDGLAALEELEGVRS